MIGGITAPGAYTSEADFSVYVPSLSTTQFGIITTASKGPTNKVVQVSTLEQLITSFGPVGMHHGLQAGAQFLRQGNLLQVVRVASSTGARATQDSQSSVVTFTPTSIGSWANGTNGLQVVITTSPYSSNRKDIQVKWRGVVVENYESVNFTSGSVDFIDTRMAKSNYVTATYGSGSLANGTIGFSGGDDGTTNLSPEDVIGTSVGTTKTGMFLFRHPEDTDVNLLAVPGDSRSAVISELISTVEDRQDCFALIDPPFGLSAEEVIDWHNGLGGGPNDPALAINSNYASLTWPWLQVYDSWSDANVWAPPSGFVAAQMALTDRDYASWFAAAGFRRGRISNAIDIEYSPSQGERARLCGRAGEIGFNAINPFVRFPGQGIVRFDCLTLQRSQTALNMEPVRRMLTYLRKVIATAVAYLVFEQNGPALWNQFKNMVIPYLQSVKTGQGLRDFLVIMDETTNTDVVRDLGMCAGRIMLKPVKPARVIQLDFTLTSQGANFQELST